MVANKRMRFGAPALALAIVGGGGLLLLAGEGAQAVPAARSAGLPVTVPDDRAETLIDQLCAAAAEPAGAPALGAALGRTAEIRQGGVRQSIRALGVGAAEQCPDAWGDGSALVDRLECHAAAAFVASVRATSTELATKPAPKPASKPAPRTTAKAKPTKQPAAGKSAPSGPRCG